MEFQVYSLIDKDNQITPKEIEILSTVRNKKKILLIGNTDGRLELALSIINPNSKIDVFSNCQKVVKINNGIINYNNTSTPESDLCYLSKIYDAIIFMDTHFPAMKAARRLTDENTILIPKYFDILEYHSREYPTLVTAIYNIRKIEGNNDSQNKNIDFYINLGEKIISFNLPMIIFTDSELAPKINEMIKDKKNIKCVVREFAESYFMKDFERIKELQKSYHICNINPAKDTPHYIIMNNNKLYFIEEAMKITDTKKYMWIDFGLCHVARNPEFINMWIKDIPDKIRQMLITPYDSRGLPDVDYYRTIYHNIGGGLFGGSKENMIKYIELFKNKYQQILDNGWYQLDEAVMHMVFNENQELFSPSFGDYPNMIHNFLFPYSDTLLNNHIQLYMNNRIWSKAGLLLDYISEFYTLREDKNWFYLQYGIVCYYYISNGVMSDNFANLLKKHPEFVRSNIGNLKYYSNHPKLFLAID